MQINEELQQYIEKNIFPSYRKNDLGHNLDHIKYVINRSLRFSNEVDDINCDMVYAIAAYHDIGHYIDAKNHEKISAEMLLTDKNLKNFFSEDEIKIMSEAVYDHRASLEGEPRSIYGKIVSSADRETRVNIQLQRMYEYRLTHYPDKSLEWIIEDTRLYIINKFGKKGYAIEKMYFEDLDYKKFLEDISVVAENKEEFRKRFMEVTGLNNK
ncbi:MAG: HD domain-containing protein [Bacilli bacterium]|nr:HD domain-containing protein [Bacilli bacterium]